MTTVTETVFLLFAQHGKNSSVWLEVCFRWGLLAGWRK